MSRSNPVEQLPNPATRIYDWHGGIGQLKCFDKTEKKTTVINEPFIFILLDELGCVQGFDQAANCGVYSNEIRDSRADVLVVKRHKQDTVAEGIWTAIRDKCKKAGGEFHAALYIAFKKADGSLGIAMLRFKGAALNAWIEFSKKNRSALYKKALVIDGAIEGKKGAITFKVPKFTLKDLSEKAEADALALDKEVQAYLLKYFAQTKKSQVEHDVEHVRDEDMPSSPPPLNTTPDEVFDDSDIPF